MKSLSILVLLTVAVALGACDDRTPKPKMQSSAPASSGVEMQHPVPGSQVPSAEPAPANPVPSPGPLK